MNGDNKSPAFVSKVIVNGKTYDAEDVQYGFKAYSDGKWELESDLSSILVASGEGAATIRGCCLISADISDLDQTPEIVFNLPTGLGGGLSDKYDTKAFSFSN